MKFKQKDVQNQRIEQITTNHLVIGIDIAKEIHVARAVNFRGIELGNSCSFSNDFDGFNRFLKWIQSLQTKFEKTNVIVGMEPTGHYWLNLAYWLLEQKLEVVTVNPYLVKNNKENRDHSPTKFDVKDALVIADMIKNGYYSYLRLPAGEYRVLREIMSTREFVSKQLVSVKNQLHRWLDLWFPEYKKVFKDVFCHTSLVTLKLFPTPSELIKLQPEDILTKWKKEIKRVPSVRYATTLLSQARMSVASKDGMEHAKWTLGFLIAQYEQLKNQMEELEEKASSLLEQIPITPPLQAIKGIGEVTLANILAETGDLSQYDHGNQILRLAGLHLGENSSGNHKGKIVITKRGRSFLRKVLYLAVMSLVKNNPEFRDLHQYNVKEKKMKRKQSILKLIGKLARILVGMVRRGEAYCTEKVQMMPKAA